MIIVQTPFRVSFFGGGTDFEDYYSAHQGAVVTTAINKYVYVIVKERFDDDIYINYSRKEIVSEVKEIQHEPEYMKILVAMPAYNEAKYIGSLVLQARKYADRVLVVDDGSSDATAETARAAGAAVIRHETQTGKGAGVQSIFQDARESGADVLILMDADFQHLPDEIPGLIAGIEEGYDVVIGSRTAQARKTPRYRRAGQKVLIALARTASRTDVSDSESGFRAFSRKAIETLNLEEAGFAVETEILVQAQAHGLSVKEVPISNIYTEDGSTLNPVKHGLGVLNRILYMISERRPLLFFGVSGGVLLLIGLILGIRVMTGVFSNAPALATGTAMVTVLLVTIGLLTIFVGIILNTLVNKLNRRL